MLDHRTVSLADQVFERLETDILSGKYQRGELLTELKLSEEMGVSRTPVREALRRLEQEHLIEDTNKGSVVLGITNEDLRDIYAIRMNIEGIAAYRAAERITDEQIRELQELLDLQEFYASKKDADHIKVVDNNFHELVYRYSGSTVIYNTLTPLHRKIQKYRKASVENAERSENSLKEHRALLAALEKHDCELAQKVVTDHVVNAFKNIMKEEEMK